VAGAFTMPPLHQVSVFAVYISRLEADPHGKQRNGVDNWDSCCPAAEEVCVGVLSRGVVMAKVCSRLGTDREEDLALWVEVGVGGGAAREWFPAGWW
jgi:hypothetical protein